MILTYSRRARHRRVDGSMIQSTQFALPHGLRARAISALSINPRATLWVAETLMR